MTEQLTLRANQAIESLTQPEVDSRFDDMVFFELIEINSALETTDLQAEVVEALRSRRNELLRELLAYPAEAVNHEFELLQRLYEGRTRQVTGQMGVTSSEFVTRDPARQKADLHFREVSYPSGATERIIEVPSREADELPFFAITRGNTLQLEQIEYARGHYRRRMVEPTSEAGQRLMVELLTHSITASDLMFNRLPDDIEQADQQAVEFLRTKHTAQRTL